MKKEETYKTLAFMEVMINMGAKCTECGSIPSFPDGWYFVLNPTWADSDIICPTCLAKRGK